MIVLNLLSTKIILKYLDTKPLYILFKWMEYIVRDSFHDEENLSKKPSRDMTLQKLHYHGNILDIHYIFPKTRSLSPIQHRCLIISIC